MQENPSRWAWTILLIAFIIFCLIAASVPLGIRQFITTASKSLTARVTAYGDSVLMRSAEQGTWTAITEPDQEISEGTTLKTASSSSSQAVVWLFDDSNLQIRNNSQVTVMEARTPRFDISPWLDTIAVRIEFGRVVVGVVSTRQDRPRRFEIHTPHGLVLLEEGNYSINVTTSETEVNVRTVRPVGSATLQAAGETIPLALGERGRIEAGQPPEGPLPGEHNLLVNGSFEQSLSIGWIYGEYHEKKEEEAGTAFIDTADDGRKAIHFVRRGGNTQHAENFVRQELDLDVRDISLLEIRLDARVIYQSLSGGGVLSSEFPLMVLLRYRDANGREHDWVRGFFYADWDGLGVRNDESYQGGLIPQDVWQPFESGNIMLSLGSQRPAHLISLEVKASGHDYESMASDVGIFVKE